MHSGTKDGVPTSGEPDDFAQDSRTLERRSPSKHRTSQGKGTGAGRTSQGTIDPTSMATPFQLNSDFQQKNAANDYQLNRTLRQGEEDDILINSCDEFNQGSRAQYLGQDKIEQEKAAGLPQIRQKNEKSLSLHDPNIDKEFLKKIHSVEIQNQMMQLNQGEDGQQHLRTSQNLRASDHSLRMRRDLSTQSLNQQNSNKAQNDSASKRSKIPSQMMQDYETKPLKRQSSLNLKVKSRNSDWRFQNSKANVINDAQVAQQFDTDNPFKRKKHFSIYHVSNKVLDPSLLLQDHSKDAHGRVGQKRVNMTPSKRQMDEICSQLDGGNRDSRPSTNIPSRKRQGGLGDNQIRPQDLFESPGNRQKTTQKAIQDSGNLHGRQISGNQSSNPSAQVNPLDTPDTMDVLQKQQNKKMIIQTSFPHENPDQPEDLRTNRINEVINENSDFESQQNTLQEKMESPVDMGFNAQGEPLSARMPAAPLRDYPLLYRSGSVSKIVDLQRKSFDMPYLTTRRATHHLHSFYTKQDDNKEVQALTRQNQALRKELRDQNAEFIKQKAVLEQQVHLLTQQLSIEQERSKNLKKNYTAALAAFKQKKRNSSESSSPRQKPSRSANANLSLSPKSSLNNGSNLSRQNAQQELTKSYSNQLNRSGSFVMSSFKPKTDPWSAKKMEILQKDNKDLQLTIKRLEELIQATKEQSKSQNNLMYHKEQEIIQLRANIHDYEAKLKAAADQKMQPVTKHDNRQSQRLEQEIKKLKTDQDRKIAQSIEEYQARNVLLNDQIIDYQTQIKHLNNEINAHMSRINLKEQSYRAMEQQVQIYENQVQTMQKEHAKIVDEYDMKQSNFDKERAQLQTVIRQLREKYDKANSTGGKQFQKKFSAAIVNSSTDNMFCQSNNITDNNQPEETIKFASSANNSTHQFETSIHNDRESSNLNGQRHILTTEALVNASTIPVDRVFSDLSKSHLEIQTCIAQVYIMSKQKKQAAISLKYGQLPPGQTEREASVVLRDPVDDSMELKDRDGLGISPIILAQGSQTLNSIAEQEIMLGDKRDPEDSLQTDFRLKHKNSRDELSKGPSKTGAGHKSPSFNEKPLKLSSYWANEEQFKDDGTCSLENVNGLRRLIANLRNKRNKLMVKFNNLKHDSLKEIKKLEGKLLQLQNQLKQEKDRRVDVQLQKIEQSSALYETINEKATKINQLKLKINEIESEKDELQSLGLGPRLSVDQHQYQQLVRGMHKISGRDLDQPSIYQSQQLYNLKGLPKSASRPLQKTYSAKRNSAQTNSLSLKSLNNINMEEMRQKFMEQSGKEPGAMTQRSPSREVVNRTMQRYMTERPQLETNPNDDFNPLSNEDVMSPGLGDQRHLDGQNLQKFTSSLKGISFQDQIQQNELLSDDGHQYIPQPSKVIDQRSPPVEDVHVSLRRSPVGFIHQSHLQQSKMLTMKSLDSQSFPKLPSNQPNSKSTAGKPPQGFQKKMLGQADGSQILSTRSPKQAIPGYKSPDNAKSPNSFDSHTQIVPQNANIDTKNAVNDFDSSRFDGSVVNIMSPPGGTRRSRDQRKTPDNELRRSIKNARQGAYPQNNGSGQGEVDQASLDSEKDLDIGQENQGSAHQGQINLPPGQVVSQQPKRDIVPPLNLQYAAKMNVPNTTTNQANQGNKGLFYSDAQRNRMQKVQSPQNSHYKQFLSQNSDIKQNPKHHQSMLKPQIIQRPKIQSYLTQNLPVNQQALSERKAKGPSEHLIKKTLPSKNLAARSNYSGHYSSHVPDDQNMYTAKSSVKKAYKSPKSILESARKSSQHPDDNAHSNSVDPNEASDSNRYQPTSLYNKATSYLSSQKMTPNTVSADQQSSSFRGGGLTDHKNSYSLFGGGNSNQRHINSFFSQPSQLAFPPGASAGTPNANQHIAAPYNIKTDDSMLHQQQSSTDIRKKIFATGRLSKQSNHSYDSNVSQTVKQPAGPQGASRQSTAQQMYQAYKNKYLSKK